MVLPGQLPLELGGQIKAKESKSLPSTLQLEGTLDFLAGEGEEKGNNFLLIANTGKPVPLGNFPHPVIVDMEGAEFDKKTTPVIADHDTALRIGHTTDQIILKAGESRNFAGRLLKGPLIAATGVRSSESAISKEFAAEAKKGFPFQVSIGARIKKGYILEEGDSAKVNGRSWDGPLVVAKATRTRELTITVLGADNDTSAIFAKESDMKFTEWLESLKLSAAYAEMEEEGKNSLKAEYDKLYPAKPKGKKGKKTPIQASDDDPDDDDDDDDDNDTPVRKTKKGKLSLSDRQSLLNLDKAAEQQLRIDAIGELSLQFKDSVKEVKTENGDGEEVKMTLSKFKAHAIRSGMSETEFELTLRRSEVAAVSDGLHVPNFQVINRDVSSKALEASILRFYGRQENEKNEKTGREYGLKAMGYSEKDLEASHKPQHRFAGTISELLAHQVYAVGKHPSVFFNDPSALMGEAVKAWNDIRAVSGASALSITNVLENVMHKATLASFEAQETTWRNVTAVTSLSDFRVHNRYRLDMNGHFRKVSPDGELKHVGMTDTKYTLQLDTYGAMIMVDRRTRIDDDLGIVMTKANGIGMLGALRIEEAVYVLLLSNPGSFFAAGNNNLLTGAGSALGLTAFTTAQQTFRDQVVNGKPVSVSPSILLVGTNNAILADRLFTTRQMALTTTADTPGFQDNPFAGLYRPVVTGYLNNTNITDQDGNTLSGQSDNHWYLFSNPNVPQGAALNIGFLNGRQTPFIDSAETQFNVPGGIQMRAYFDFGVGMQVYQLALRSAGS